MGSQGVMLRERGGRERDGVNNEWWGGRGGGGMQWIFRQNQFSVEHQHRFSN